jgi:hypothetical protein
MMDGWCPWTAHPKLVAFFFFIALIIIALLSPKPTIEAISYAIGVPLVVMIVVSLVLMIVLCARRW